MSMELLCFLQNGGTYTLTSCVSFRFVKERYTPHTLLEGTWYAPESNMAEVSAVAFYYNGKLLHFGYPAGTEIVTKDGRTLMKVRSRGYTDALSKNQPAEGVVTEVDLLTLGTSTVSLPNVEFEANTPVVNYVNYYDGTSLWDAIVCYSLRATGVYPYIRGANTVRVTHPSPSTVMYVEGNRLISSGAGWDYSNLISSISSTDVTGTSVSYSDYDNDALARNIVRQKDIPFDREWIMAPEAGLRAKLNYSKRGYRYDSYTVKDYLNIDLLDRFAISGKGDVGEISKITVSGGNDVPVTTEIRCYHDAYVV